MYLIDESYFNGLILIPNLNEPNSNNADIILSMIDNKVRLFLIDLLGVSLFKDLDSHIEEGELKSNAPVKWQNLVNGCYYTHNSKEYYFPGLLQQNNGIKTSLLAYFVYHEWLINNLSIQAGIGEVIVQGKNAVRANPTQKLVKVWNDFVTMNQGNKRSHPAICVVDGVRVTDWYYSNEAQISSVIAFLEHNKEDYPNANRKLYRYQNTYGLV